MNGNVQTCPAPGCGKTVHEQLHWVQCPYFKNQLICLHHCKTCKYNMDGEGHCSYSNYSHKLVKEIKEFKNQARAIKGQV